MTVSFFFGRRSQLVPIELDLGQTITVIATPINTVPHLTIELLDPSSGVVGSAFAPGFFEEAVLQTAPVAAGGLYTIRIGDLFSSPGLYSVRVLVNSAVEGESYFSGVDNSTIGTAQDINGSFIDVGASGRGAVLGRNDAPLGDGMLFESEPNQPRGGGGTPFELAQNVDGEGWNLGDNPEIFNATIFPHVSINGTVDGSFDYYTFTVDHAGARATFDIGYESFDTMLFLYDAFGNVLAGSDDNGGDPGSGSGLASYIDYTFGTPGTYVIGVGQYFSFDNGGQLGGTPVFPGNDYTPHVSLDGAPLGPASPDYYSFTLEEGEVVSIVLTSRTGGHVDMDVRDGGDGILAIGSPVGTNVDEVITFTAPAAGTNYVRVGGQPFVDYSLVVTREAQFELEANNSFDTAQDISPNGAVLGHVGQQGILYGASRFGELFTIDLSTGAGTFVGLLPFFASTEIEVDDAGNGFSQLPDGNFGGVGFDPATGAATTGLISNGASFTGLEWVGDTLYGAAFFGPGGPSSLYTLDPITGAANLIGATGVAQLPGLAYDATTGIMYGITGGFGPGAQLLTIDLNTGAATVVGSTGFQAGSLEFGPDGNLYAGGTSVSSGELWRVDKATGASTFVGFTGFSLITGLALSGRSDLEDWFSFSVNAGDTLSFETATPADGPGEFVNLLDPHIELYDPTGSLVPTGTVLADGRNERVEHTAALSGAYRIRVTAQGGSRGEYVLSRSPRTARRRGCGRPDHRPAPRPHHRRGADQDAVWPEGQEERSGAHLTLRSRPTPPDGPQARPGPSHVVPRSQADEAECRAAGWGSL